MINTLLLTILVCLFSIYIYMWGGVKPIIIAYIAGIIIWCIIYLIKFFVENYKRGKDEDDEEPRAKR